MKLFIRLSLIIMLLGIIILPLHANLRDGLLLYFSFDEVNGDTIKNSADNGHDGVLEADASISKDIVKNGSGAIRIDGGSQAMTVETFTELEEYQEHTLLFWIYFTAPASGGWDQIIAKPAPGSDRSPGLWVTPEGLSIHYRYNPGNLGPWGITQTGNQNGDFFDENTWYHIAGVTEGGEIICYVNGTEVHKDTVPGNIDQGSGGFHVGNSPAYAGAAAKFIADDVAFYNRALSEDEVNQVMDGAFLAVDASDKLASTWGKVKSLR